jgi:hypothetical protein
MSQVYWKPKYGTRCSRHREWAKKEAKREAAAKRPPRVPLHRRLRRLIGR